MFTLEDTFRVFERIRKACTIDYAETGHSSSQRRPFIPERNCCHPSNFQNLLLVFANSRLADGPCRSQGEVGQGLARKSSLTSQHDSILARKQAGKSDPSQVATDMRTTRNADGSRKFSRDKWLTKGQVQSFFSRLSAISRKRGVTRAENVESDDEGDLLLHEQMARVLLTNVETRRLKIFLTRWA